MRGLLFCALIACVACFSVGCNDCCDNCPGCSDQFGSPFQSCPGGQCYPNQPAQPNQPACPDGRCPWMAPNGSIEVGAPREGAVDRDALEETKSGGGCPTCPNYSPVHVPPQVYHPTHYPSRIVHPVVIHPTPAPIVRPPVRYPAARPAPSRPAVADADRPREGVFRCRRCGQPKVGQEWKELWADDSTPLTCLCRDCWARTTPAERAAHLRGYIAAANLPRTQAFYANAVVAELSRR